MNHTVWAMMDYHSAYSNGQICRPGPFSFRELGESAEACIEAGGANGFWFYTHDIRRADSDTSPYSMAPSPDGGTRREFKEMVKRIRGAGGRSLIWMSTAGLNPRGDIRPEWASRGVDGRPYTSWGFDAHEFITACNPLKPGFRQYFLDWIRRYLENYDVDGFFFDCGVFAHPCDFSPDFTADHFAGEAGPAMRELYLEAWELIQSIKPGQVHVFHEGVHADFPGSGYMVCGMNQGAAPGELTLQGQMSRFQRHGQRLNWSSFTPFDLQSGFVHWNPVAGGTDREALLQYAADPMNQLVCRLVREKGVADARYLRDGASLLGNVIVTVPGYRGSLAAAGALEGTETLEHALTGERVVAVEGSFSLTGKAAYRMIK